MVLLSKITKLRVVGDPPEFERRGALLADGQNERMAWFRRQSSVAAIRDRAFTTEMVLREEQP